MNHKRMVLILLSVIMLALIPAVVHQIDPAPILNEPISPYLSLGFLMLAAYLTGLAAKEIGLPALTGYLLAGMLFGPFCLDIISLSDIHDLELINAIALSFIAITAGGELRMSSLKRDGGAIGLITLSHTVLVLAGTLIFMPLILILFPINGLDNHTTIWMIAILITTIAVANSPATTIAIINEFKSRGPFTDVVLGVTMVKDVVVLVLFAIAMAVVRSMDTGTALSLGFLGHLLIQILISIAAGCIFGILMILFYRYVAKEVSVFIVLASLTAHELALVVGLEHMLMCMVAGFVVQNFSSRGALMIEGIERSQLPIYVIFFSIAGAGLDFTHFGGVWFIVLVFVILRTGLVYGGTWLGGRLAGSPPAVNRYAWTGFLTNAGLSLSIVIVVEGAFPTWGSAFKALAISFIAINQIAGPVLFKIGLQKSGETRV